MAEGCTTPGPSPPPSTSTRLVAPIRGVTLLTGRLGHTRIVVATVIEEELAAAKRILRCNVASTPGYWGKKRGNDHDLLVTRIARSNTPAALSVRDLLEAWRPNFVVLCGIAGGVGTWSEKGTRKTWHGPREGDVVVGQFVHYADYAKHVDNATKMRYFPLDHPPSRLVETLLDELQASDKWRKAIDIDRPGRGSQSPHILGGEFLATESLAGSPKREAQRYMLRFFENAVAVDMESAGVARSIHEYRREVLYNPRWISVRGISDHVWAAPDDAQDDFTESKNQAQRERFRGYAAATAAAATKEIVRLLKRFERDLLVGTG